MLNDRPLHMIARNLLYRENYRALARMGLTCERPVESALRYFFGHGSYPCSVRVRTPIGVQGMTLFNSHDAMTLNEIFFREDYKCPSPARVVVDIGSNIGISALYFLTRSESTFCELYEPDPSNVEKLLHNLRDYEHRFSLHEAAVADREGTLPFGREKTGRYGALKESQAVGTGIEGREIINVRVEHINSVLERVLARHDTIDLLKVDTEGSELAIIEAIDPAMLARVRHIAIEWFDRSIKLDGFGVTSSCDTVLLTNRAMSARGA